jgi:high-affinity Fe2+/Pb2+ permease
MVLIDALLVLAMLFFLFLPITDRKTVRMKLIVLCVLLAALTVSVTGTDVSPMQLAGIASVR